MLNELLLWNYCLSVYLVGIKKRSMYNMGARMLLVVEFWYLLLILLMLVLVCATYTFPLYILVLLLLVSWFISYMIIGKWVEKRLKKMCIGQFYNEVSNKKKKTWIGFIILLFCWLSFVIVAFTFFVGYSLREYSWQIRFPKKVDMRMERCL